VVSHNILDNFAVKIEQKSLEKAKAEGAIALFGEKYSEDVRTVQIGNGNPFSYELCAGTHVKSTSEIGTFLIVSEGSAAAGIRRIEAITGRKAYETIRNRFAHLQQTAIVLKTNPNELFSRAEYIVDELEGTIKDLAHLRQEMASGIFDIEMQNPNTIAGVSVLAVNLPGADRDTLRQMADRFRQKASSGIAVIASIVEDKPAIVATITDDLVKKGLDAGNLVNFISEPLGGKGGGRPNMAQAGGKHPEKLEKALSLVNDWAKDNLK